MVCCLLYPFCDCVTSGVHAADNFEEPVAEEEATHSCKDCGRGFKYLSGLREHQRSHTGEMPYRCPYPGCTFKAKWRSSLHNHKRYHNSDVPAKATVQKKSTKLRRARPQPTFKSEVVPMAAPAAPEGADAGYVTAPTFDLDELRRVQLNSLLETLLETISDPYDGSGFWISEATAHEHRSPFVVNPIEGNGADTFLNEMGEHGVSLRVQAQGFRVN